MWPSSDLDADERGEDAGSDGATTGTVGRRRVLAAASAVFLVGCNTASDGGGRRGTDPDPGTTPTAASSDAPAASDTRAGTSTEPGPVDGTGGAYGQPVVCDGTIYVGSCVKQGTRYVYDNYLYVMG